MKKFLKSVICGTCEQCTDALFTVDLSTIAGWTKKERERERERGKTRETRNAAVDVEPKHIQNKTRLILIGFPRNEEMFSVY